MPVSITSTPKPNTSSPSASTSTSSKSTSALSPPTRKRPTPTDHIFNYTYTYGYNFGYISNGLALLEDRRSLLEEALKKGTGASVLPLTTTTAPLEATTERTTSTTTSTTSRKESSTSSTTLSLTFSAASPVTSSAHPFSPYYRTYIELVSSGALNDGSKKARASTSVSPTNTNANNKTKQQVVVPLSLANLNSLEKKKRKREIESPDMKDLIDREREYDRETGTNGYRYAGGCGYLAYSTTIDYGDDFDSGDDEFADAVPPTRTRPLLDFGIYVVDSFESFLCSVYAGEHDWERDGLAHDFAFAICGPG
ncbi:hypothetical protein CC1G_04020 [Coprinopsis cinerea okayama7|uniref:Uncharacterized protein n=1 Tax=Coprinopsis cinerea (strain Okayama-7 / 130 / ATCC MYA-4618 / FGSC 9003) TaxID=240176 RepID=A8N8H3_COPC7|nr:hypothetical protein CC1G_04020 [Coprinopsis cinerea okayama7\|eukprot:XP_001831129.1 hypothetical protein CC1G_04020 [Coprinopsis cinerea okayama7\